MAAHTFQPMDRLDHEDDVEFLLVNDTVVLGRMLKGGINGPATRSYWTRDRKGKIAFVRPVGWRPLFAPSDARTCPGASVAHPATAPASGASPAVKSLEAA